jgi:hypothetical protein
VAFALKKKPRVSKHEILWSGVLAFRRFGVQKFEDCSDQWFGIETLELPVPRSLKSRRPLDQREAYRC